MVMIDYGDWPFYQTDEIEAVQSVLRSGKVNYWNGEEGRNFEGEFANYCGASYAIAVANGTLALELAMVALEIGEGDEVIVPPRTFLASVSIVILHGARPVFAEIDPESQNITPATARAAITKKTKAIVAVHLAGWPCDLAGLRDLADEWGLQLIEDCAQAHGASFRGRKVGSWGDAAAFSFCTDKIMSTGGEGGMLLLQEEGPWRRAWSYKDHGKDWDAVYRTSHPPGFRWLHHSFGSNWRLTEMQAAIGRVQLTKLDDWLAERQANASLMSSILAEVPLLRPPQPPAGIRHAFYAYYAFIIPTQLKKGWDRDRILAALQEKGVPCRQGICPEVYREPAFANTGLRPVARFPVAKELGETSLMVPVHPGLERRHVYDIAQQMAAVCTEASKS